MSEYPRPWSGRQLLFGQATGTGGESIKVYSSTDLAAGEQCAWVATVNPDGRGVVDHPPSPGGVAAVTPHLTRSEAVKLRDALTRFIEHRAGAVSVLPEPGSKVLAKSRLMNPLVHLRWALIDRGVSRCIERQETRPEDPRIEVDPLTEELLLVRDEPLTAAEHEFADGYLSGLVGDGQHEVVLTPKKLEEMEQANG